MAIQKPGNPFSREWLLSAHHRIYQQARHPDFRSLDACLVDKNKNGLAHQWLHQLLKDGAAEINLQAKTESIPDLFHLYFTSRNNEKLCGQKTLAFAYPLFYQPKTASSPKLLSPLFLWRLDLSPDDQENWNIRHDHELPLFPNLYLLQDLKDNYGIDLTGQCESLCRNRQLNSISLAKILHQLVSGLKLPATGIQEMEPIQEAVQSVGSAKAAILKAGLIGIFPNPGKANNFISTSTEKPLINLHSPQHQFSLKPSAPDQNSIVETIFNHRSTNIEGPPGSGKTFSLCNVLSTSISNGRRNLVIVPEVTARNKIMDYFAEQQLDQYIFNYSDPEAGLKKLIRKFREKEAPPVDFDETEYRFLVNKAKRDREKLEKQFRVQQALFFENQNWRELVGQFLKNNREEGKELLNSQLNPLEFDFIIPEYESMMKAVRESRKLFFRLKTFSHPLRYLNRNIFLNLDKAEARFFVEEQISVFQEKARVLHHRYILKQDDYSRKLRTFYERHYQDLLGKIEKIRENIDDYTELYGEDFIESGLSLKVYGVFSNRAKNILQARSNINRQYLELRKTYQSRDDFDFNFYENVESKNTHRILKQLDEFEIALNEWRQTLNAKVQEEVQRLSNKTVHPNLDYQEQIDELEYALDLLAEELNTVQIYEQAFQNKMLTIPMRQQYLEGILDQLEESVNNLRDFDAFYDWNRYWLSLPAIIQKLIRALVKVKPKNWEAAFKSWYFYHLLNNHYQPFFPADDQLFTIYTATYKQLVKVMPRQIAKLWADRFTKAKKQLKKSNKEIYSLLFKTGSESYRKYSLDKYLEDAFGTIADRFPIILATPAEAEKLLSLESVYFDFIGIYQTPQSPSKWPGAIRKANHTAFFKSSILLPGNTPAAAAAGKLKSIQLSLFHRQQDFHLSSFLNAPFYHNKLKIRYKDKKNLDAIEINPVGGRYQVKAGINKKEAEMIVRKLQGLSQQKNAKTSGIGVACATVEQRNLISSMLLDDSQKALFDEILVLDFEDLNTQVFDVLLISMVYDKIPYQRGQQNGFNFSTPPETLCPLFANALDRSVWFHSFSEEQIDDFSRQEKVNAPLILSRFFHYGNACQTADYDKQQEILALFPQEAMDAPPKVFTEEIAQALSPYFGGGRILKNFVYQGIHLPLAIRADKPGEAPIAILQDGFLEMPSTPAYLWENIIREKLLAPAGIRTYTVWSVNWWRNPKLEARKLASAVIKMGN